jgi:hypothetical protein
MFGRLTIHPQSRVAEMCQPSQTSWAFQKWQIIKSIPCYHLLAGLIARPFPWVFCLATKPRVTNMRPPHNFWNNEEQKTESKCQKDDKKTAIVPQKMAEIILWLWTEQKLFTQYFPDYSNIWQFFLNYTEVYTVVYPCQTCQTCQLHKYLISL